MPDETRDVVPLALRRALGAEAEAGEPTLPAGGAMVFMIGLSLLEIKRLPVANFLPALVVAPLLAWLASHLP